jgi:hypothetical protein
MLLSHYCSSPSNWRSYHRSSQGSRLVVGIFLLVRSILAPDCFRLTDSFALSDHSHAWALGQAADVVASGSHLHFEGDLHKGSLPANDLGREQRHVGET